jgi:uroporphyrin-III C-methyltransferase/precorrin-2 dehydrogenase/sirohydrochlorin ferrochelatase
MRNLLPLFLDLTGRRVLLVGGGPVAAGKLNQLLTAGARVRIVSPLVVADIERAVRHRAGDDADRSDPGDGAVVALERRPFRTDDLDDAWLVVAAATPAVNREVAIAAEARRIFVNAVDDPANASAYLSGVVRRDDVIIAISTGGDAPALTALVREGLDAVLPRDLGGWVAAARQERQRWRRDRVPMEARKPLLLHALNRRYDGDDAIAPSADGPTAMAGTRRDPAGRIPWLSGPDDSWL